MKVAELDSATAKAVELGGKVIAARLLVPDIGHFSQIVDPTGATFGLWEPLPGKDKK
jgi:predicted enzyme related to lactoylglutathione lyase